MLHNMSQWTICKLLLLLLDICWSWLSCHQGVVLLPHHFFRALSFSFSAESILHNLTSLVSRSLALKSFFHVSTRTRSFLNSSSGHKGASVRPALTSMRKSASSLNTCVRCYHWSRKQLLPFNEHRTRTPEVSNVVLIEPTLKGGQSTQNLERIKCKYKCWNSSASSTLSIDKQLLSFRYSYCLADHRCNRSAPR